MLATVGMTWSGGQEMTGAPGGWHGYAAAAAIRAGWTLRIDGEGPERAGGGLPAQGRR
jgi:hypothetical protein